MNSETLEQKVERLALEVADLRSRMEALAAPTVRSAPAPLSPGTEVDAGEEIVRWMAKSSFLPRVSTACFLLVAALILRTVTDNGLLDKQLGSLLGMAYATLLILIGGYSYARSAPLAPVFSVCGAVLMYTVILETHAHFASLPSVPAYILLVFTGVALASISYFHGAALPVLVGSLGMGIAATGIDYPDPYYPNLSIVLLVANLLGAFATRLRRCSWLRWILLFVTAVTLLVWGVKLSMRIERGMGAAVAFGLHWYLPLLILFALLFFGTALFAFFRLESGSIARFDSALPAVNALWILPAVLVVAKGGWGSVSATGVAGIFAALLHGGAAWLLVRTRDSGAPGVTPLIVAASLWFGLSAPAAAGSLFGALPFLSLAAIGILRLSHAWSLGNLRALSYLMQVTTALLLTGGAFDQGPGGKPVLQAAAGACLGIVALQHFLWCRKHPPLRGSRFFDHWDKDDRMAVFLLMSSLAGFFFVLRSGIWISGGGSALVFQAAQSIVINLAAACLVLLAFRRRNREVRNIGILLILLGAGRVLVGDLPRIYGLPLVGSVLSFGIGVSLVSVALTRWQKPVGGSGKEEGAETTECGKYA